MSSLSSPHLSLILLVSSWSSPCCYLLCIMQALFKSFASLHYVPVSFFYLLLSSFSRLLRVSPICIWKRFVAQYVSCCTQPMSGRARQRGPLYTFCQAILGPNIQWLQLRNEWPLSSSSHCTVTCSLTLHPPLDHKKCWQPKCSLWLSLEKSSNKNTTQLWPKLNIAKTKKV